MLQGICLYLNTAPINASRQGNKRVTLDRVNHRPAEVGNLSQN